MSADKRMTAEEKAAFHEFFDLEKQDVAARYGAFRCADCIYWFIADWQTEKAVLARDPRKSPPRGECRRRAPIARPDLAFHVLAGLVGAVAWATEEIANIEHDNLTNDYLFERTECEIDFWPSVEADAWCGEGRPGRKAMSAEMIARLEALDALAFPPEEEEEAVGE